MKREFSAGGIVFNQKGEVLITEHSSYHHWGFPKGLIDEGSAKGETSPEASEEAALREVKEEGGVEAEIVGKVGYSKYPYTHPETKERIFKIVTYFLMKYISGSPSDHDFEVEEAGWYEPEDALEQLTFSQDKTLLKKALEMKG